MIIEFDTNNVELDIWDRDKSKCVVAYMSDTPEFNTIIKKCKSQREAEICLKEEKEKLTDMRRLLLIIQMLKDANT